MVLRKERKNTLIHYSEAASFFSLINKHQNVTEWKADISIKLVTFWHIMLSLVWETDVTGHMRASASKLVFQYNALETVFHFLYTQDIQVKQVNPFIH